MSGNYNVMGNLSFHNHHHHVPGLLQTSAIMVFQTSLSSVLAGSFCSCYEIIQTFTIKMLFYREMAEFGYSPKILRSYEILSVRLQGVALHSLSPCTRFLCTQILMLITPRRRKTRPNNPCRHYLMK